MIHQLLLHQRASNIYVLNNAHHLAIPRLQGNAYCIHDGDSRRHRLSVPEPSANTASSFFLSSIGTHYAGITRHLWLSVARKLLGLRPWFLRRKTNAFQYFWIAIYIGTYGYLRGSSALVLSCFLYYSLRTSARPKYSGHDVNVILNLIKILLLSVNLSIAIVHAMAGTQVTAKTVLATMVRPVQYYRRNITHPHN